MTNNEFTKITIDGVDYQIDSTVKIYIDSIEANRKIAIDELNELKKENEKLKIKFVTNSDVFIDAYFKRYDDYVKSYNYGVEIGNLEFIPKNKDGSILSKEIFLKEYFEHYNRVHGFPNKELGI